MEVRFLSCAIRSKLIYCILQCVDKNGQPIAVYEYLMDEPSFARLTVRPDGWQLLTEIVATLILNRIAIKFDL